MKKESKNEGVAKSCPACRKTLLKSANLLGQGSFKTKCPYCQSLILVEISQKSSVKTTLIKLGVVIFIVVGIYQVFTLTSVKNALMSMIRDNLIEYNK